MFPVQHERVWRDLARTDAHKHAHTHSHALNWSWICGWCVLSTLDVFSKSSLVASIFVFFLVNSLLARSFVTSEARQVRRGRSTRQRENQVRGHAAAHASSVEDTADVEPHDPRQGAGGPTRLHPTTTSKEEGSHDADSNPSFDEVSRDNPEDEPEPWVDYRNPRDCGWERGAPFDFFHFFFFFFVFVDLTHQHSTHRSTR